MSGPAPRHGETVRARTCARCWFASGGEADHCGRCRCCPESARLAARARRRTYRLMKVRDLTPEEMAEMEQLIAAEQRAHEEDERTRYESHAWGGPGDECVACGVTWEDCEDDCPGARCVHGRYEIDTCLSCGRRYENGQLIGPFDQGLPGGGIAPAPPVTDTEDGRDA